MTKQRILRAVLFIAACVVAFSRVYLSQHFFVDIYAGAIIGVIVAYGVAAYFDKNEGMPEWLDQSLKTILL